MNDSHLATSEPLPRGTVTFLLSDVEGSTRLYEQYPEAMQRAMARHDVLVEHSVTANAGHLIRPRGEGDSRFAVFPRATDAVAAARDIQQVWAAEQWPLPSPIRVRIALHTGEADLHEGDYYGSEVNRCRRPLRRWPNSRTAPGSSISRCLPTRRSSSRPLRGHWTSGTAGSSRYARCFKFTSAGG